MPIHKTEAIILNKYDFGETSLIVNFYTKDFGKINGILKGVKQDPKKFLSTLEPFSYNEIIFYKKRNSNLHLVTQVELKDNFDLIRNDISRLNSAAIIIDLLNNLMAPEDKNEAVFNLSLDALKELAISQNHNLEKIILIFKIKLLDLSGFKPHLDSCVCCNSKILSEARFSVALGGLLCLKCIRKDLSSRPIFRGTVASILHIEKNDFKNNLNLGMNIQIKKELILVINSFLKFHLEKELKSQKLLNKNL